VQGSVGISSVGPDAALLLAGPASRLARKGGLARKPDREGSAARVTQC